MKKLYTTLFLVLASITLLKAQYRTMEAGLQTDNDSYLANGSDRYYTNGIFIYFRQALPFDEDGKLANKILGYEVGQKMYNPQSGNINPFSNTDVPAIDIKNIDRPFAAYLYVGGTYNLLYKNQSNLKLGLQLGVIGNKAQGKPAQDFIHNTFGFYPPFGWDHQIKGGFKATLTGEYNRMLIREPIFDINFSSYANLGNAFTGLGFGPLFRIGRTNKLFNSVSTQSTVMNRNGIKANDQEFFLYYKPMINLVGYNATIQSKSGEVPSKIDFNQSDEILSQLEVAGTPKRIIISNKIGAAYNSGDRWTIDVSANFITKETKEILRSQQWGSVTLMYHFN